MRIISTKCQPRAANNLQNLGAIEWIRQKVKNIPSLIGELKPLWMRATGLLPTEVSHLLNLENLLVENFWRDEISNRWREPTDEERERMNDDRTLRVFHDAERFLAGALKKSISDKDRCEWIDVLFQCCRAVEDNDNELLPSIRTIDLGEAFKLITQLFHSILPEKVKPPIFSKAEKQTNVASQRLTKMAKATEPEESPKKKREDGQLTFSDLDNE